MVGIYEAKGVREFRKEREGYYDHFNCINKSKIPYLEREDILRKELHYHSLINKTSKQ